MGLSLRMGMSLVAGTFHQFLSAIKPLPIEVGMAMKRRETARRASDFLLVIVFVLLLVNYALLR